MKVRITFAAIAAVSLAAATALAWSAQDRYTVRVPNGLAFAEFRGYEKWEIVSVSHNGDKLAVILGNPAIISAFKSGIPGNGKPFPDGAKMAKIHWEAHKAEALPGSPFTAGQLHDVDFMAKDSKRFADSNGWGYGAFEYDVSNDGFHPATTADMPPQGEDARCGAACHTAAKQRDYVFTEYPRR